MNILARATTAAEMEAIELSDRLPPYVNVRVAPPLFTQLIGKKYTTEDGRVVWMDSIYFYLMDDGTIEAEPIFCSQQPTDG